MANREKQSRAIDTLHLAGGRRPELIAGLTPQLSGKLSGKPSVENRRFERFGFNVQHIIVAVIHPGGTGESYLVAPRELSAGGLSFIHGQYLHPKSRCQVVLPTLTGAWFRVGGRIVRCRHAKGMIHEVSVEFDDSIDPEIFLPPTTASAPGTAPASAPGAAPAGTLAATPAPLPATHPAPAKPRRAALLLDVRADDRSSFGDWLGRSGLTVIDATDEEAAMAWLDRDKAIQLAILQFDPARPASAAIARRVRRHGFAGPLLAISADASDAARAAASAAGCNAFLAKPCDQHAFTTAVDQLLSFDATLLAPGPAPQIISTLPKSPQATRHITEFLQALPATLEKLTWTAQNGMLPAAAEICQELRQSGESLGFPALTQMARLALGRLQEPTPNAPAIDQAIEEMAAAAKRFAPA